MKYDELPRFIRESSVLSDYEKELLQQEDRLPTEDEVCAIGNEPEFFDLCNAFIGDEVSRQTHLQLAAKRFIAIGKIDIAWGILLL